MFQNTHYFTSEAIIDKTILDVEEYLAIDQNIKSVLLFPAVNSFLRFAIHQTINDRFSNDKLSSFSIGEGERRRVVVCHQSCLEEKMDMTDNKQVTGNLYVPPPLRKQNINKNVINQKPALSKRRERMDSTECTASRKKQLVTMNYYIPPPLRRQKTKDSMNQKVDLLNQKGTVAENEKACNNSSLLFKDMTIKEFKQESVGVEDSSIVNTNQRLNEPILKLQGKRTVKNDLSLNEQLCEGPVRETKKVTGSPNSENIYFSLTSNKIEQTNSRIETQNSLEPTQSSLEPTQGNFDMRPCDKNNIESDLEYFNEDGDCLVPEEMEELTKRVGSVHINKTKHVYNELKTPEEYSSTIIEIYDFKDLTLDDINNIFRSYDSKGIHITWIDDSHALAVFSSSLLADEVLSTDLPNLKTRPLSKASVQSKVKAKSLVLPSTLRPKTCILSARRLVSGALGLKLPVSPAEKERLRGAREKRKQAVKDQEENFGS